MRKDVFDRVSSGILPRLRERSGHALSSRPRDTSELKRVHSGTTVLAIFYNKGILFAGDKKTSCGFSIVDQDKVKLCKISDYSGCAAAGTVSDIQLLVRDLEEVNGGFISQYGYPLSVEGQVSYLINQLRYYRDYSYASLDVDMFLGGFNPISEDFKLFQVSGDGFKKECRDYIVLGSGTDFAISKLEENRGRLAGKKLSLEEAVELAVRAISMAGKKDLGTSDIRVACPDVAVIDKDGFSFLETAGIRKVVRNIIKKEV